MIDESVLRLLEAVRAGRLAPADALDRLAWLPVEEVTGRAEPELAAPAELQRAADQPGDTPFARLDHHRALRLGFPEVVFGAGKTTEQIVEICIRLADRDGGFLVTRADQATCVALARRFPECRVNETARVVHLRTPGSAPRTRGTVLVVSAGTSDLPVAEEAAATATALGNPTRRLFDVGVAGLHRIVAESRSLAQATVVIVVAGMEGALPSVVGGLVSAPVIAVPTSVGYGASFHGLAALLGMLNSCSAGVTVVNIDNGFGAACAATRINRIGAAESGPDSVASTDASGDSDALG